MKLDDDSFLSAYLDSELGTAEHLRVRDALLESPELAEKLTDLAAVRSLLQNLPRPTAQADLSNAIVSQIDDRRHKRLIRSRVASLVIAALLMLACVPLFLDWPRNEGGNQARPPVMTGLAKSAIEKNQVDLSADPTEDTQKATILTASDPEKDENLARFEDQEQLQSMLEQPEVRRVVLVIDSLSAQAVAQVRDAVIETGRQNPAWGELRVNQGIVLDESHPDEAHVFALLMDDQEYDHFQQEVKARLPESEPAPTTTAEPGLVTQLADLEPVQVGEGWLISPLTPAPGPSELATRSTFASKAAAVGDESAKARGELGEAAASDSEPARTQEAGAPRVYLVWLTTPRKEL